MKKLIQGFLACSMLVWCMACGDDDASPVIKIEANNATFTVNENVSEGFSIGKLEASATRGDESVAVSFNITSQSVENAVIINATTGAIEVLTPSAFDFDINTSITLIVEITAEGQTKSVEITINIVEEDAIILTVSDTTFLIDENPENGATIGTLSATAVRGENQETIAFSLINQSIDGALSLDESTGEFTVSDSSIFDFESNTGLLATVSVQAGDSTKTATVIIDINNIPDVWIQVGGSVLGEYGGDRFGRGVTLSKSGLAMAAGAPENDDNGTNSGHVRVFTRNDLTSPWTQVGSAINGEAAEDFSGLAVALNEDGDRVVIGSYRGFSFTAGSSTQVHGGHVRVFDTDGASWVQAGATIPALRGLSSTGVGPAQGANFGQAVAITPAGDQIAVGAPAVADGDQNSDGYAVAFRQSDAGNWGQFANRIDGTDSNQRLGYSVSLSADGTIMAVGSPAFSGRKGRVHVYQLSGSTWTLIGSTIEGDESLDRTGIGVSLSSDGNTLAVGSDRYGQSDKPGTVKVYKNDGGEWVQLGATIEGRDNGDRLGQGIALSGDGNTLVAGAFDSEANGDRSGYARVYKFNEQSEEWEQSGPDFEGSAGDRFGVSVAIDEAGTSIIIGGDQFDNDGNGYVKTYNFN